jgi:uncharacterized membrane protein
MLYLVFLMGSLALLGGFFALIEYETRRGARVFATHRERFDERVRSIEFIFQHVDLAGFLRTEVQALATRVGHDLAHLSLQLVRVVERVLTRVVRYLRSQHRSEEVPRENAREFVKTLSAFKDDLKGKRPNTEV